MKTQSNLHFAVDSCNPKNTTFGLHNQKSTWNSIRNQFIFGFFFHFYKPLIECKFTFVFVLILLNVRFCRCVRSVARIVRMWFYLFPLCFLTGRFWSLWPWPTNFVVRLRFWIYLPAESVCIKNSLQRSIPIEILFFFWNSLAIAGVIRFECNFKRFDNCCVNNALLQYE